MGKSQLPNHKFSAGYNAVLRKISTNNCKLKPCITGTSCSGRIWNVLVTTNYTAVSCRHCYCCWSLEEGCVHTIPWLSSATADGMPAQHNYNVTQSPYLHSTHTNMHLWSPIVSCSPHQSAQKAVSPLSQQSHCHLPAPRQHGWADRHGHRSVTLPSVAAEPRGSWAAASSCWGTVNGSVSGSLSLLSLQRCQTTLQCNSISS